MLEGDTSPSHLVVIAGEPSGDALAAQVVEALARRCGSSLHVSGVGGPALEDHGFESLYPIDDIAVMGMAPDCAAFAQIAGPYQPGRCPYYGRTTRCGVAGRQSRL